MIKIKNLSFTYPGVEQPQLKNVSLNINAGEFVAIIGHNGCGKSTLCKALNGLIPHYFNGDYSGDVEILQNNTKTSTISQLAQMVGYVYQDFENQLIRPTAIDDASFACMNYAYEDYLERGRNALKLVGLSNKEKDYIWQLSGGQKHLLALASASALSPDVLILDEPIAQLDPINAIGIYEILKDLNVNHNKTIIVIEHHTEFIASYCNKVVMMNKGEVMWKLDTKDALNRIDELCEVNIYPPQVTLAAHTLRQSVYRGNDLLPITLDEGVEYFQTHTKKTKPTLGTKPMIKESPALLSTPTIEIKSTSVTYPSVKGEDRKSITDLHLTLRKGENIGLVGNNGAGKTTLFKLIAGLIKPSEGKIIIQNQDTKKLSPEKISDMVSLVYQNPEQMFIRDSISSDIIYAMKARGIKDYDEKGYQLMKQFRLLEIKDRDGRLLSGGQMRRASLAIGVALNPSILLLDEPTANLDIATKKEIITVLASMKGIVDTAVIASHDMQLIAEWADRIIVLHQGRILADGTREEIFSNEELMKTAGIVAPSIYQLGKKTDENLECFTIREFVDGYAVKGVI